MHASANKVLAALRGRATDAAIVPLGDGDVTAVALQLGEQRVLAVAFDYGARHGSIGIQEADQIVRAFHFARSELLPIALLLETSGIRVTDGTAGIASLRRVLREAEDARLDGLPMLGVVLRCAFGGASILAALCERRIIQSDSLYGMSGPRLIAETAGTDLFDAADPAAVRSVLGGRARARLDGFELVGPEVEGTADVVVDWVRSIRVEPVTTAVLIRAGAALDRRLNDQRLPSTPPIRARSDAPIDDVLSTLLPGPRELRRLPDIAVAVSEASLDTRVLVLQAPDGAGARHALALSQALLESPVAPSQSLGRIVILVDTPGHRATPGEERVVLSDFLAHLALTIRHIHRGGKIVDVIVAGLGGGGIQGALGSGATSVSMARDARLLVLLPSRFTRWTRSSETTRGGSTRPCTPARSTPLSLGPHSTMATDDNFFHAFERSALAAPDAACLEVPGGEVLSRAWLSHQSARYAGALGAAGCRPGDRVAAQVDKSPHALALYLACIRAGLVYLPANTAYRPAELAYLIADGGPRIFVGRAEPAEAIDLLDGSVPPPAVLVLDENGTGTLEDLAATAGEAPDVVARHADDVAALLYTSGTTGRPKGAMLSHRAMTSCALALGRAWRFGTSDVLLHALPLFHGHGLFVSSNVALAAGARLQLLPRFDIGEVIAAFPRATVFMGVPTFYHRLLGDERLTPESCSGMRLFTCGSAPLAADVQRAFARRTGHEIVERYGATETMILCTNPLDGERRPGSVGRPLPEVDLRIADDADDPLPAGATGTIQVRGPGLFNGYWNLPEATRAEFTADGFFRTGDLGSISADGYVSITGRAKDLIISGGYNVYPAEVEATIDQLEAVRESAVVAVPHADFGEAVTAFVVPASDVAPPTTAQIIRWCRGRLANYKVPKRVHIVAELPRNTMGKVVKTELREAAAAFEADPGTLEATA